MIENTTIAIQLLTAPTGTLNALIKNSSGTTVMTLPLTDRGSNFYSANITDPLAEGLYFVVFKDDSTVLGDGQLLWDGTKEILAEDSIQVLLDAGLIEAKGSRYIFTEAALQKAAKGGGGGRGNTVIERVWSDQEKDKIRKALGLEEDVTILDRIKSMQIDLKKYPEEMQNIFYKLENLDITIANFLSEASTSQDVVNLEPVINNILEVKELIDNKEIPLFNDRQIIEEISSLKNLIASLDNTVKNVKVDVDLNKLLETTSIEYKGDEMYNSIISIKEVLKRLLNK